MNKPVIGIPEMGKDQLIRILLRSQYPAAVKRAGGKVRWLPWTEDAKQLKQYIHECDGFIFPGGADISPTLYGEREAPDRTYHRQRDAMEIPLMRLAVESGKPVLGICRGCQMMNVALGGTLHGDIKEIAAPEIHMAMKQAINGSHDVELTANSLIQQITNQSRIFVNTLHHQAVKDPAPGISIAARSPGGIIEAIEYGNHPFCIGVQWHPELMIGNTNAQKLFNAFMAEASR